MNHCQNNQRARRHGRQWPNPRKDRRGETSYWRQSAKVVKEEERKGGDGGKQGAVEQTLSIDKETKTVTAEVQPDTRSAVEDERDEKCIEAVKDIIDNLIPTPPAGSGGSDGPTPPNGRPPGPIDPKTLKPLVFSYAGVRLPDFQMREPLDERHVLFLPRLFLFCMSFILLCSVWWFMHHVSRRDPEDQRHYFIFVLDLLLYCPLMTSTLHWYLMLACFFLYRLSIERLEWFRAGKLDAYLAWREIYKVRVMMFVACLTWTVYYIFHFVVLGPPSWMMITLWLVDIAAVIVMDPTLFVYTSFSFRMFTSVASDTDD